MLIGLQKGFLYDILCVFLIAQDPVDPVHEHPAVPQAQFSKCLLVSRFRFRKQLLVRWLRVPHSEMFENTCAH
jgi:hypothetical protein